MFGPPAGQGQPRISRDGSTSTGVAGQSQIGANVGDKTSVIWRARRRPGHWRRRRGALQRTQIPTGQVSDLVRIFEFRPLSS
jgi:hypothetical protein